MDLQTFVQNLRDAGEFEDIMLNNVAQFGTPERQYLGAQILPERMTENQFTERGIRYKTVVAVAGTRYSPASKRSSGRMVGEFDVKLGHSDIERDLLPEDYDALIHVIRQTNPSMEQAAQDELLNFTDEAINRALIEFNEIQRWQYWVNGQIIINYPRGGQEIMQYPEPKEGEHRVTAGGNWSDDSYDPMQDIVAQADLLRDKGYQISRIVTRNNIMSILTNNQKMKERAGNFTAVQAGDTTTDQNVYFHSSTRQMVNSVFQAEGLPVPTVYDLHYNTQEGRYPFLDDGTMVFFAQGTEENVENRLDPEDVRYLPDTLGYTAVGYPAGHGSQGRVVNVEPHSTKPPRVNYQGWQASIPVPQEPEATAAIDGIE